MTCQECGKVVPPIRFIGKDGRDRGWFVPKKFCSLSCNTAEANRSRSRRVREEGGYVDKHGYVILPPGKRENYRQPEHRFVMEQKIGRKLHKDETVHHKDGNRRNNHPDNLELWSGRHGRGQRVGEQDIWSGMIPKWVLEDHSPY